MMLIESFQIVESPLKLRENEEEKNIERERKSIEKYLKVFYKYLKILEVFFQRNASQVFF